MRKKQQNQPLVSIVMPVYNAGAFLVEALNSIVNQTYANFKFIIVDDASTDKSLTILRRYAQKHKNIKLLNNKKRLGVSETVKRAILNAKGKFLARMDADDVSFPGRIEKQINYLLAHKDTVAVGGQCLIIDSESHITGEKIFPTKFQDIYKYIFRFVPLQQPTLMVAANRLPKNFEYYRDGMNTAEEVELLFKLFQYGKVENLEDPLLLYRIHKGNTSLLNLRETFLLTLIARVRAIYKYGYKPNFIGILVTLAQSVVILLLPRRVSLFLYKILRKLNFDQQKRFALSHLAARSSSF